MVVSNITYSSLIFLLLHDNHRFTMGLLMITSCWFDNVVWVSCLLRYLPAISWLYDSGVIHLWLAQDLWLSMQVGIKISNIAWLHYIYIDCSLVMWKALLVLWYQSRSWVKIIHRLPRGHVSFTLISAHNIEVQLIKIIVTMITLYTLLFKDSDYCCYKISEPCNLGL